MVPFPASLLEILHLKKVFEFPFPASPLLHLKILFTSKTFLKNEFTGNFTSTKGMRIQGAQVKMPCIARGTGSPINDVTHAKGKF